MTNIPVRFDEAVDRFSAFLLDNNHAGQILWVFADDMTSRGTETWIRWPVAEENYSKVLHLYDSLKAGSGLRFDARCRVGEFICSTISAPKLDDAETGRFISGLTLSVVIPLREAQAVRSKLQWQRLLEQNGTPPTSGTAAFVQYGL